MDAIPRAGVFWSYAHEDDRLDSGRICSLAQRLTDEYSLATGEELEIFVDRSGIQWGQAWRERIDQALSATTFFIPVLSPRYFTRVECRNEMLSFHQRAQELGMKEVLLPILYVPIQGFTSDNPDEFIALASRYQYVDWTGHRLAGEDSPQYRGAVHELAERLRSLGATIGNALLSREIAAIDGGQTDNAEGLFEVLERVMQLIPDWLESVEISEAHVAQVDALADLMIPRIEALEIRPGQGQARFSTLQRFAREFLPIAQRHLESGSIYARRSIELDPLVMHLIQTAAEVDRDDASAILSDLYDSISKAVPGIDRSREIVRGRERGEQAIAGWIQERAHLSRLVRQLGKVVVEGENVISGGNAIVERWLETWDRFLGGNAGPESAD